jgi:hypothetical protein
MSGHASLGHLDVSLAALWDARDFDWLRDAIRKKNFNNYVAVLEELLQKQGEPRIDIETGRLVGTGYHSKAIIRRKPMTIAKKIDLVVTAGLQHMAKMGTGESTTSWTHMAAGTGANTEASGDIALQTELTRIAMGAGFRFSSGTDMKFAGAFPTTTPTGAYREFGILNAASSGDLFTRTVVAAGDVINHTQNSTVFSFIQVVSQSAS